MAWKAVHNQLLLDFPVSDENLAFLAPADLPWFHTSTVEYCVGSSHSQRSVAITSIFLLSDSGANRHSYHRFGRIHSDAGSV